MNTKTTKKQRKLRVSMKLRGTKEKPRLAIFRSNRFIYAQIIDDGSQKTIVSASEKQMESMKGTKTEKAKALGVNLATMAKKHKVTKVVFDKSLYKYHGRVKALAEGAREGGLEF